MNTNELYHYGVKGMKWGVRRYQNYDGSYTRAGLKRFENSLGEYEKADKRYKDAKSRYKSAKKSGSSTMGMETEITNSKLGRKNAKNKLVKDYKHLKQDKLGDQGKILYANGKTITGNNAVTSALSKIGGATLSAAVYNNNTGRLGGSTVTKVLAGIGGVSLASAGIKGAIDYDQNRKLRAYYSHTSNY